MAVKQILGKVTVTPKGEYSSGETYKRLDIVTSNGQSYIAKVDNTGVSVTNTNTWLQLVEKPEKGIDYFTEEDIAQLVSMVTDDSESEFNEYYNGKVSDFDSNASSKTREFNSNYDEKVESFNTIFDTSTDNFDGNYETKLSAFNENASTQTSTFNSVVEQATSDFNSNASTLTETFNTNASEKTSAFNINASEKTQEFNDNVDEKTEQITSQLDNYVQFDDYPSNEKAGVIKSHINGFQVSENGNPNAEILSKEQYDTIENQYFISKGTLENIKDDYVESSTPVKNLNTSLIDITPKNNVEGTDNVFDDGLKSPLFALSGDGKSEQVVATGKAIVDLNSLTEKTINGITFTPVFKNGLLEYINVNGTSTAICWYIMASVTLEENQVYSFLANSTDENVRFFTNTSGYVTTKLENKTNTRTSEQHISINVDIGKTINNARIYPMIAKSATIEEYEPYTGGQPSPNPDYPQEINSIEGSVEFNCRGKNWLNYDLEIANYFYNSNGEKEKDLTGQTYVNQEFLVYNNKQFVFNFSKSVGSSTLRMCEYDVNGNFIKRTLMNALKAITLDYNTYKVIISTNKSDTNYFENPQLEIGTQATEYEPYIEPNEVTFNLNDEKLRSVGDVKDELVVDLDTGDYFKVENIGEEIFDGSEEWGKSGNTSETNYVGVLNGTYLTDFVKCKFGYGTYSIVNYFARSSNLSSKQGFEFYNDNGQYYISLAFSMDIDTVSNIEEFKQWLSTHNTIVDYVLQNPTTKKLGTLSAENLAKLKTFKGYNNVTVNTNLGLMNIRFTYGLDIKKYVDNELLQLEQNIITNLLNIMPETVQAGIVDKEVNSLIGGI